MWRIQEGGQRIVRSCIGGPASTLDFTNGVREVVNRFLRPVPFMDSLATVNQGCKPGPNHMTTLQGTNISHQKSHLKMIFLFPRWDMLIPWRVYYIFPRIICIKKKQVLNLLHLYITGWWFQMFFIFSPIWGRWTRFDEHIVQRGWFNHETRLELSWFFSSFWVYSQVNPKFWLIFWLIKTQGVETTN